MESDNVGSNFWKKINGVDNTKYSYFDLLLMSYLHLGTFKSNGQTLS